MARRNRPGQISLDDIKLEGGIVVKVHLDKETGIFHARYEEIWRGENIEHHGGESWEGKDLEKIRKDVHEWAKREKALKWEPVIAIGPKDSFGIGRNHSVLGQSFERLMRAKKHKGDDYEWRSWAYNKPTDRGFVYDTDLEVYPPSGSTSEPSAWNDGIDPVVMEYTPERWLALLKLIEMEKTLRDKLHELVAGGEQKLVGFLAQVPTIGLLGLAPKGKK